MTRKRFTTIALAVLLIAALAGCTSGGSGSGDGDGSGSGPANGDWAWIDDSNVVGFSDWVSDYHVTTTVDINGTPSTSEFPLPSSDSAGTTMTIPCTGDSLGATAEGSPFTQHWTAGD